MTRELRTKHGMTQTELAKLLGVSMVYVSYLETGRREPSLAILRKMSKVFGEPAWVILAMADTDKKGKYADVLRDVKGRALQGTWKPKE